MFRRPFRGRPTLLAVGISVALQLCFSVAHATPPTVKLTVQRGSSDGFVKDRALARLLGEMLFRDTVDVMGAPENQPLASGTPPAVTSPPAGLRPAAATPGVTVAPRPDLIRDNSAVAQVARTVLARQKLDKYLWLIQQAFDDSMWKGGDRSHIEQHFPLIWRTSILMYEAGLTVTPHRVRVCAPADNKDGFDCRDEVAVTRIVPIPTQAPLIQSHPLTSG